MKKATIYVVIIVVVSLVAGVVVGLGISRRGHFRAYRNHQNEFGYGKGKKLGEQEKRTMLLDRIGERLNLSQEQKEKIKSILEASREEVIQARKTSVEKFKAIKERTDNKIRAVLNEAQAIEYDKIIGELKERIAARGGIGAKRPGMQKRQLDR